MPLPAEDQAFRKQIFTNLKLEESLKPGDPRYEHVYDRPGCEDPAGRIRDQIELSGGESTIFLSGFRGSGKTTELLRLKHELEPDYVVIYADAIDYLNPSQPIEISSLLIVLAGAFDDAARAEGIKLAGDSYWTRFSHWLTTTDVGLKEVGIKAGADLKLELRSTPTFRQRVDNALKDRIGELHRDVQAWFELAYQEIRKQRPDAQGVVFLFDSLEQIRGSLTEEAKVFRSVEFLFSNHLKFLSIPYFHVVYTVPPWLKFLLKGVEMTVIPCVRTWKNDDERTPCREGIERH